MTRYRLGPNITEQAHATENRGTVVVSARLLAHEFDMLSDMANLQDRSVSEVIRSALRIQHHQTWRVVDKDGQTTASMPSVVRWDDDDR